MPDDPQPSRRQGEAEGRPGDGQAEFQELRRLLAGEDRETLARLQARLDDPEIQAREVGSVLPEAISLRAAEDGKLAESLADTIDESLRDSVRKNPQGIVDALFPVMGPAIRKAISETIARMVQSLNKTLEHSLSPRALKWRFESWRTGKPFAEVVLLHTLLYRVEQVFLIHGETGLLLNHVAAEAVDVKDGDVVSGMLTAIQDFVRDSFGDGDGDSLDALDVGDLTVWIERGPHAVLAVVIRGNAPLDLRTEMQGVLEAIHLEMAHELEAFEGDDAPFGAVVGQLERCLQTAEREPRKKRGPILALGLIGLVLLAVLLWVWSGVRSRGRWDDFIDRLAAEPGIVVTARERQGGRWVVSGLRDPLAADPQDLLAEGDLDPDDFEARFKPYFAVDPEIVRARVDAVLTPPDTVEVAVEAGVLTLAGEAPDDWVAQALARAPAIAGVEDVRSDGLRVLDAQAVLLARATSLLRPPAGVTMTLDDGVLRAEGRAPTRWIEETRLLVRAVAGVERFDDTGLVASDADALALEAALSTLRPPADVVLSLADGVLVASGEAPLAWIERARLLAPGLPGVETWQEGDLRPTVRSVVARARAVLRPPPSVGLSLQDGVLTATGSAPTRWLERARALAQSIPGVRAWEASGVGASDGDTLLLERAAAVLRPPATVELAVADGRLVATGSAPQRWIDEARLLARTLPVEDFVTDELWIADLDALLLARATQALRPPDTVALRVQAGVLHASGEASHAWIVFARAAAPGVEGITAYRDGTLVDEDLAMLAQIKTRLEGRAVLFRLNRAELLADQTAVLDAVAADVKALLRLCSSVGRGLGVELVGQTDSSAAPGPAEQLARQRAQVVYDALVSRNVPASALTTGVSAPPAD
ncbi:MAG: hypothetical protein ACYTG6_15300, partial [Planctomycetota bacterium]